MSKRWRINADVGEGADDSRIMAYLDCANICCGAHAGGRDTMRTTLALAKRYRVVPGAHPGYPDRATFGRTSLGLSLPAIEKSLREQMLALSEMAAQQALNLAYVKPHGALNHDMLENGALFTAICRTVAALDPALVIMVPTNPRHHEQQRTAKTYGLNIWWELFADRAYQPDGLLRPRCHADAVHSTAEQIIAQLDGIVQSGTIRAIDGSLLDVGAASTVCVHGEHPASVEAVRRWAEMQS